MVSLAHLRERSPGETQFEPEVRKWGWRNEGPCAAAPQTSYAKLTVATGRGFARLRRCSLIRSISWSVSAVR